MTLIRAPQKCNDAFLLGWAMLGRAMLWLPSELVCPIATHDHTPLKCSCLASSRETEVRPGVHHSSTLATLAKYGALQCGQSTNREAETEVGFSRFCVIWKCQHQSFVQFCTFTKPPFFHACRLCATFWSEDTTKNRNNFKFAMSIVQSAALAFSALILPELVHDARRCPDSEMHDMVSSTPSRSSCLCCHT